MANLSQRIKHGKALCGKVFSGFVDTFNSLVDFKDNLKGDDDVSRGSGHISLDRRDKSHPVIRCTGCAETMADLSSWKYGCYAIENISFGNGIEISFKSPYYRVGGKTYTGPTTMTASESNCIVALKAIAKGSAQSATLESYANIASINAAEQDSGYYIIPLYKFASDGSVECDFRIGPTSAMGEF